MLTFSSDKHIGQEAAEEYSSRKMGGSHKFYHSCHPRVSFHSLKNRLSAPRALLYVLIVYYGLPQFLHLYPLIHQEGLGCASISSVEVYAKNGKSGMNIRHSEEERRPLNGPFFVPLEMGDIAGQVTSGRFR